MYEFLVLLTSGIPNMEILLPQAHGLRPVGFEARLYLDALLVAFYRCADG